MNTIDEIKLMAKLAEFSGRIHVYLVSGRVSGDGPR